MRAKAPRTRRRVVPKANSARRAYFGFCAMNAYP